MSDEEAIVNIIRLMTSFHLEIKALPDGLKCAKCKSVLKNACQMPCGCRFCRACIDDVISRGDQFCPGGSQECGRTPLSTAAPDYRANKSVLKLTAKCPHTGCPSECQLVDMEGHMRACSSNIVDCPFRELGCAQGALPGEQMSGHLLKESRSHCEILIGTVANISRDMEMLKQELLLKDDQGRHLENEMKLIIDENKSIKDEIKSIKIENKSIKDENELIKDENKSIKDENKSIKNENKSIKNEIKSIKDENKSIKDENKSIKDENKSMKDENKSIKDENKSIKNEIKSIKIENESIKREKEVLCNRVRQLSVKLEREIDERCQSDKRDSVMVTAVTAAVASNRDEMEPVRGDIRSIKNQFDRMKCRVESILVAVGLGQLDDWLIEEDVLKTEWNWDGVNTKKTSCKFGLAQTFELVSVNSVIKGELWIYLLIWADPGDRLLEWPFRGAVTVTATHRDKREKCSRQTRQCHIERSADNQYSHSAPFQFPHAALKGGGVDLRRGVRVSCRILPGAGQ